MDLSKRIKTNFNFQQTGFKPSLPENRDWQIDAIRNFFNKEDAGIVGPSVQEGKVDYINLDGINLRIEGRDLYGSMVILAKTFKQKDGSLLFTKTMWLIRSEADDKQRNVPLDRVIITCTYFQGNEGRINVSLEEEGAPVWAEEKEVVVKLGSVSWTHSVNNSLSVSVDAYLLAIKGCRNQIAVDYAAHVIKDLVLTLRSQCWEFKHHLEHHRDLTGDDDQSIAKKIERSKFWVNTDNPLSRLSDIIDQAREVIQINMDLALVEDSVLTKIGDSKSKPEDSTNKGTLEIIAPVMKRGYTTMEQVEAKSAERAIGVRLFGASNIKFAVTRQHNSVNVHANPTNVNNGLRGSCLMALFVAGKASAVNIKHMGEPGFKILKCNTNRLYVGIQIRTNHMILCNHLNPPGTSLFGQTITHVTPKAKESSYTVHNFQTNTVEFPNMGLVLPDVAAYGIQMSKGELGVAADWNIDPKFEGYLNVENTECPSTLWSAEFSGADENWLEEILKYLNSNSELIEQRFDYYSNKRFGGVERYLDGLASQDVKLSASTGYEFAVVLFKYYEGAIQDLRSTNSTAPAGSDDAAKKKIWEGTIPASNNYKEASLVKDVLDKVFSIKDASKTVENKRRFISIMWTLAYYIAARNNSSEHKRHTVLDPVYTADTYETSGKIQVRGDLPYNFDNL